MELLWNKPDCEKCRHYGGVVKSFPMGSKKLEVRCHARRQRIAYNDYFREQSNCMLFNKK